MDISFERVAARRTTARGAPATLLATVASAFDGRPIDGAVLARCDRRARLVEVVCVGGGEVVATIAPIAAGFGAEVVVEHVLASDVRAGRAALRRGFVVVGGSLRADEAARVAHAPA